MGLVYERIFGSRVDSRAAGTDRSLQPSRTPGVTFTNIIDGEAVKFAHLLLIR